MKNRKIKFSALNAQTLSKKVSKIILIVKRSIHLDNLEIVLNPFLIKMKIMYIMDFFFLTSFSGHNNPLKI